MSTKICCDRCDSEIKFRGEGTKVCFGTVGPIRAETEYFGPDVCDGCLADLQRTWQAGVRTGRVAA